MDFSKYLSFADFKNIHQQYLIKENPNDNSSRPNKKFYDNSEIFFESVFNFLTDFKKENGLKGIEYSEGHNTSLINTWKKFITNKELEKYEEREIGRVFFLKLIQSMRIKDEGDDAIFEAYKKFTHEITQGNFDFFDLSQDDNCSICGQKMKIEFKHWHPTSISYDETKRDFLLSKPCLDNNIVELDIEFKTGELLVADWFRIDEFTNAVSYNKDYSDLSINYTKGREKSTRQSVEKFNYITIHVGNSCPSILKNGNNFIFGHYNDEIKSKNKTDYQEHGTVCTDLWNVTIIEKQQLINIISQKVGTEKAEEIVEDYLENNTHNYKSFNIEPGNYKLRFHPDYKSFAKKDDDDDHNTPTNIQPFFTLKKFALETQKKLKI